MWSVSRLFENFFLSFFPIESNTLKEEEEKGREQTCRRRRKRTGRTSSPRAKRWHETAINRGEIGSRVAIRHQKRRKQRFWWGIITSPLTTNDQYYMGVDKATLLNTPEEGLTELEAERRLQLFRRMNSPRKEENVWVKLALESGPAMR